MLNQENNTIIEPTGEPYVYQKVGRYWPAAQPISKPKMDPLNFVYWLQGFLEIAGPSVIRTDQIAVIKEHIGLVLTKETHQHVVSESFHDWGNMDREAYKVKYGDYPQASC